MTQMCFPFREHHFLTFTIQLNFKNWCELKDTVRTEKGLTLTFTRRHS